MAINKVVYNNNTLIDLTEDTADASTILSGYTAHDRSGAAVTGAFDPSVYVLKAGDTMSDALRIEKDGFTAADSGRALLILGNNKDEGTEGNSHGALVLYTETTKNTILLATQNPTTNNMVFLPNGNGILALVGDITSAINALATVATSGSYNDLSDKPTITDSKVLQTATASSDSDTYPLLLSDTSHTADSDPSTITSGARILGGAYYQPSTATLYLRKIHSGTTTQYSRVVLGNATANGTAGACYGQLVLYGKGSYYAAITDTNNVLTASRTLNVPNATGTLSLIENLYSTTSHTAIPANANINTAAYTVPGKYYCNATNAASVTNSPYTSGAFVMIVENTAGTSMVSIEGVNYAYRRRWLYASYSSTQVYTQICSTNASGVESYGNWYRVSMTAVS